MSIDWFDLVSGSARGPSAAAYRAGLRVLSVPFSLAVKTRRWLYGRGIYRSRRASIPVVSVGNITVGGTGKTPLVEYLAAGLRQRGRKPAIVMRGYKAPRGQAGDEATMLAGNLGEAIPVVENRNRHAGVEHAAADLGADVALLDDGFQHIALKRDIDIVAIDATNPFGFGRLLPAGGLREAPAQLRRAHLIVITRSDLVPKEDLASLREQIRVLSPETYVLESTFAPVALEAVRGGDALPVEELVDAPVAAFCGIGNPHAFGLTLRRAGARVVLARRFADHHAFTRRELESVMIEAHARQARFVVTTQKDASRVPGEAWDALGGPPVYILTCSFALTSGEEELWKLIEIALSREADADRS